MRRPYALAVCSNELLHAENIGARVEFGVLGGGQAETALRLMSGVFAPTFLHNQSWPAGACLPRTRAQMKDVLTRSCAQG